jgi:hypothetical protein
LSVLDRQLDGDSETLPVAGSLGDVFSDLLGGLQAFPSDHILPSSRPFTHETQGTDLGRQSGRRTNLTTDGTEVDDLETPVSLPLHLFHFLPTHLDLSGVDLGSHFCDEGIWISGSSPFSGRSLTHLSLPSLDHVGGGIDAIDDDGDDEQVIVTVTVGVAGSGMSELAGCRAFRLTALEWSVAQDCFCVESW